MASAKELTEMAKVSKAAREFGAGSEQHKMAVKRAIAVIKKYLGWCLKSIPGRDIQGFLYVANTLRLSLRDE